MLTPKTCGLLLIETTEDSSARYFPLSRTIGAEYVLLFAMSRTIADSLGRCYLLSRTIRDEYVFNSIMSNRLSDRYPGRAQKHTPHIDSTSTHSPFAGRLVGRMQYAPTLPEKERFPRVGITYCLGQSETNTHFISPCLIGYQIGTHVGAQKHTPPAHLSSTISPLAGRLVGRMQYAPTLPAEKSDFKGWWEVMFGTRRDEYVFHFFMSKRLSDGYPGRAQKNTPPAHLSSTISPFAGHLVGRMQYAPTLPAEKSDLKDWCGVMFGTMGDESVFHSSMSNRLLDRSPCRGVLHTPLARLSSTPAPFAGRLVRRMQYAPTFPEKDEVSSGGGRYSANGSDLFCRVNHKRE